MVMNLENRRMKRRHYKMTGGIQISHGYVSLLSTKNSLHVTF